MVKLQALKRSTWMVVCFPSNVLVSIRPPLARLYTNLSLTLISLCTKATSAFQSSLGFNTSIYSFAFAMAQNQSLLLCHFMTSTIRQIRTILHLSQTNCRLHDRIVTSVILKFSTHWFSMLYETWLLYIFYHPCHIVQQMLGIVYVHEAPDAWNMIARVCLYIP